jgi:hypothetical protein
MNTKKHAGLVVFTLFLFLTACTPAKFKTLIVGTWEPVKMEMPNKQRLSIVDDSVKGQPSQYTVEVQTQIKHDLADNQKGVPTNDLVKQVNQAIDEPYVIYAFTSQGRCTRTLPGGEQIHGTWKFKNFGKRLLISDVENKQSVKLDIDTLTHSKLVARNVIVPKGMSVTYKKK